MEEMDAGAWGAGLPIARWSKCYRPTRIIHLYGEGPHDVSDNGHSSIITKKGRNMKVLYTSLIFILLLVIISLMVVFIVEDGLPGTTEITKNVNVLNTITIIEGSNETLSSNSSKVTGNLVDVATMVQSVERTRWLSSRGRNEHLNSRETNQAPGAGFNSDGSLNISDQGKEDINTVIIHQVENRTNAAVDKVTSALIMHATVGMSSTFAPLDGQEPTEGFNKSLAPQKINNNTILVPEMNNTTFTVILPKGSNTTTVLPAKSDIISTPKNKDHLLTTERSNKETNMSTEGYWNNSLVPGENITSSSGHGETTTRRDRNVNYTLSTGEQSKYTPTSEEFTITDITPTPDKSITAVYYNNTMITPEQSNITSISEQADHISKLENNKDNTTNSTPAKLAQEYSTTSTPEFGSNNSYNAIPGQTDNITSKDDKAMLTLGAYSNNTTKSTPEQANTTETTSERINNTALEAKVNNTSKSPPEHNDSIESTLELINNVLFPENNSNNRDQINNNTATSENNSMPLTPEVNSNDIFKLTPEHTNSSTEVLNKMLISEDTGSNNKNHESIPETNNNMLAEQNDILTLELNNTTKSTSKQHRTLNLELNNNTIDLIPKEVNKTLTS